MKKSVVVLFFLLSIFCRSSVGASLSLQPISQTITANDFTDIELVISGLGGFTSPSLAAFYAEINFDSSVLGFESVAYGPLLGDTDPSTFETDILTTISTGMVSLDEFSFLLDFELDALQPDTFTLATLTFKGLAAGTSPLSLTNVDLSDAAFPANSIIPTLENASITVNQASTVPEPSMWLLMLVGLMGLLASRRQLPLRINACTQL